MPVGPVHPSATPGHYFAYGSNMEPGALDALASKDFGDVSLGPARLPGHRLAFTRRSLRWSASGVADIPERDGCTVWGGLFRLVPGMAERLDAREGAGFAYRRTVVEVQLLGDTRMTVLTLAYKVLDPLPHEVPPHPVYVAEIVSGAAHCGLPATYQRWLSGPAGRVDVLWRSRQLGREGPDHHKP